MFEQNQSVDFPAVVKEAKSKQGKNKMFAGDSNSVIQQNVKELMRGGAREESAHKLAMANAKKHTSRHKNLGKFLHSRKDGKPHGSDM